MKKASVIKRTLAVMTAAGLMAGAAAPGAVLADDDFPVLISSNPLAEEEPVSVIAPAPTEEELVVIAPAPTVEVVQLVEYTIQGDKTFTKTLTDEATNTTVNITATYPYVRVKGNASLAKAIRTSLKAGAFTQIVNKYKGYLQSGDVLPTDSVINVEVTYDAENITRSGNIASFEFNVSAYVEGGAYPANAAKVVNINLSTGNRITLGFLFKKAAAVKEFAAQYAKDYADALYAEAAGFMEDMPEIASEYSFLGDIAVDDILQAVDIYSVKFSWEGMELVLDETDGLWPHAFGTQKVFIPYEDYCSYLKDSRTQLIRPYSVEVIDLEYNSGTGYMWTDASEAGEDACLELIYEGSYALNRTAIMLAGGRQRQVLVYKAVEAGRQTIRYELRRSWETDGEPADSYERNLIVTDTMFITDDNGEV